MSSAARAARGWLLPLALMACGSASAPTPAAKELPPRDLILITIDTLRADRVGAYGHEAAETPTMDRLAREGVRVAHAVTPLPRTTPGLASLLTGLYPHHHGAREVHERAPNGTSLAEVLSERGYATVGVTANAAAGPRQGLDRGFDPLLVRAADASVVTEAAIELAEGADDEAPLFLWAHYVDPHWPYSVLPEADAPAAVECTRLERQRLFHVQIDAGGVARDALEACGRAHDQTVAWTDRQIGVLLESLEERGRLERALVVVTADHGEAFGERDLYYAHGPNVHGAQLDVPLIFWGDGVGEALVDEAGPVSLIDLAPTVLRLMQVPDDEWPEYDGRSVAGRLGGPVREEPDPRPAFFESAGALNRFYAPGLLSGRPQTGYCLHGERYTLCWKGDGEPTLHERASDPTLATDVAAEHPDEVAALERMRERWGPGRTRERAVIDADGELKLVERPKLGGGYARFLYDLSVDPAESRNLRDERPADAERLGALLDDWTDGVPGYDPAQLTDEAEATLRALGYVE
jgi:arylsulfatase A-like enzyme